MEGTPAESGIPRSVAAQIELMVGGLQDFFNHVDGGSGESEELIASVLGEASRMDEAEAVRGADRLWQESMEGAMSAEGCAFLTACLACAQAMRANNEGNQDAAWGFAANSAYWLGMAQAHLAHSESLTGRARKAAEVRHAENRALKATVFEWYAAHGTRYRSIDSAAEAVAGKVVPVTFRTAQKWISQWRKMQSARKA